MCGIAGFVDGRHGGPPDRLIALAEAMNETLRHRGPDDGGVWTDAETGVALANRRLAVRDLSSAGHQPMVSDDGRLVLTYNGEIYDTRDLRASLEATGRRFRGGSDTEVLLQACAEWGVEGAVRRCNGMFAFALWDRVERRLTLARDRMGIKPLYWVRADGLFLFASELKALVDHPGWTPEIDRDALAAFARLSYVPSPLCIWKGARKLEPGTVLTLEAGRAPTITRYWNMGDVAGQGRDITDMNEAVEGLDSLLGRAVRRRLVADVPLGLFLSGGMDSATVAGAHARPWRGAGEDLHRRLRRDRLRRIGGRRPHRATPGHRTPGDQAVAGRDPGPRRRGGALLRRALCRFVADSDPSGVPAWPAKASPWRSAGTAATRSSAATTVTPWAEHYWPRLRRIPLPLRRAWAGAVTAVPPVLWDRLAGVLGVRQAGEKAHKAASILALDDEAQAYRHLTGHGIDATGLVLGGREPPPPPPPALDDPVERLQVLDTVGYLPDDILTKVDRASMSVGLKVRVPLLDHEVVAFAWRLARRLKVSGGRGKRVLGAVTEKYLPASLFAGRPKSGFAVPIDAWLRGPLRDWAGDLLSESALRDQGTLDAGLGRALVARAPVGPPSASPRPMERPHVPGLAARPAGEFRDTRSGPGRGQGLRSQVRVQKGLIDIEGFGNDPILVEVPLHEGPALRPHGLAQLAVAEQGLQGVGEGPGIANRDQDAVLPGTDDLAASGNVGGDDGPGAGRRLEKGLGQALAVGRQDGHVGPAARRR